MNGGRRIWQEEKEEEEEEEEEGERRDGKQKYRGKVNTLILLEIEKEIVREVARGDKPYLRKSADRKAQISLLN